MSLPFSRLSVTSAGVLFGCVADVSILKGSTLSRANQIHTVKDMPYFSTGFLGLERPAGKSTISSRLDSEPAGITHATLDFELKGDFTVGVGGIRKLAGWSLLGERAPSGSSPGVYKRQRHVILAYSCPKSVTSSTSSIDLIRGILGWLLRTGEMCLIGDPCP